MDKRKKLKYQIPRLVPLDSAAASGTGQCQTGSAANQCFNGTAATIHSCSAGTGASCSTGTQYVAGVLFQLFSR